MKIFFDTEFTGLVKNTNLISIGMVTDQDHEFYAEFTDYGGDCWLTDWIEDNVISNLEFKDLDFSFCHVSDDRKVVRAKGSRFYIRDSILEWLTDINTEEKIEVWSDCLAYDWVLLCDLFGGAMHLPESIYYIPFDICTLFKVSGIDPDINREEFAESFLPKDEEPKKHNALWDAKTIKACYKRVSLQVYWKPKKSY